ncbi:cytochrome P450 [Cinnamomum micranthum f. kanehirae]|uniref:Cytochrome P450 n=1 Tax=Cinnamomum micranthum f. kanehirae TaxID=337451 RepID=A0A443NW62_9MAGN|nr:cytochrome P450 [Cinnamomum micranthum f. kanehirae]
MDSIGTCAALALGALPLFIWLVWSWNEVRFLLPLKLRSNGANLPPGHMGLPLLGEMLSFLWYFRIVRRPDDFILSKRKRYGRGVGLYRTHLFGSPSIIACEPSINKFILQSDDLFSVKWPSVEIVGRHSLVAVNGAPHTRVRTFVVNALNKPEALKKITLAVQPRLISSLHHWAHKGRIKASDEITKVTFENICKMFVSLDPGPLGVDINKSIKGVVAGIRAQPFNFPGTAYHRALQCRNKLTEEFRRMLEARKKRETVASDEEMNDLMDGLRQIRDEEGKQLGDEEVIDNIISLVIAGYESTSVATMWSLYYLCKYPNVLRQLKAENMEIRERKKGDGDFLTMDDISEMKYTRKVVEETIRIANVSPTIFRRANEDVDYQEYPKIGRLLFGLDTFTQTQKTSKIPSSSIQIDGISDGANIPPGNMGLPFFGEMLSFLWYFKILRRPDDFIISKRKRYGRGVGIYKTHLFGSPSIIACDPPINKFILQSDDLFRIRWPSVDLVGRHSFVAAEGETHSRLKTFVLNAINKPDSLKQITQAVQPRLISSLRSWADKGRIKASDETDKVTFQNICQLFVSLEPGPLLDEINKDIKGVVAGIRAQPFNIPGTANHHALQCRRKLIAKFRRILETRKQKGTAMNEEITDLMDGLMHVRDGEGKLLHDEAVLDNIVSLVIGGYESTALSTMWSLYYLYKFPDVLWRLRSKMSPFGVQEEHMAIRERKEGFITMDDISEMKYTRKVVEETIRMANISPMVFRQANKDVDYQGNQKI